MKSSKLILFAIACAFCLSAHAVEAISTNESDYDIWYNYGVAKPCYPVLIVDEEEFITPTNSIYITTNYDMTMNEYINNSLVKKDGSNYFSIEDYYYDHQSKFINNLTWNILDYNDKVDVQFTVTDVGGELSSSTKYSLEEEIAIAIKQILDKHFPPNGE